MIKCQWCGKQTEQAATITIGNSKFRVCSDCVKQFKARKCIECGAPINMSNFDKGRCIQCAQVKNYQIEKSKQDKENAYPYSGLGAEMSDDVFNAWMTGQNIKKS